VSLMRPVYASESRLVEANRRAGIARIVAVAQRRYGENHVTGLLMATPGGIAQVLEGERLNVAETYGRIVVAPRHANPRLLTEKPIEQRHFPAW